MEEGEGRRNIQDKPTSAEMQIAICGRGARPPRNHRLQAVILVSTDRPKETGSRESPEWTELLQPCLEPWLLLE